MLEVQGYVKKIREIQVRFQEDPDAVGQMDEMIDCQDKRCPGFFLIRNAWVGSEMEIIPYFSIRESPNGQIVGCFLGSWLCKVND